MTMKFCVDCTHHESINFPSHTDHFCKNPKLTADSECIPIELLITGIDDNSTCFRATARKARMVRTLCGRDGSWYEAKNDT